MALKGGEFLINDIMPEEMFTPEDFTKEHKMLEKAVIEFAEKEVSLYSAHDLKADGGKISIDLMKKAGELGVLGAGVPEEYGGEGMDTTSNCIIAEGLGFGNSSFITTFAAHNGIGTLPLNYFGTDAQKKKYLEKLCSGESIAAYCLTEADAGSDALNAKTSAVLSKDGKHYILNGEKIFITNGSWADIFTVYAKVIEEGQNVEDGKFTAFLIEKSFPGISIGAEEDKLGIRGSSTTSVILKDCKVPVENVLYDIGKGHKIAFNILNIGRAKLGQMASGGAKKIIRMAVKQAKERKQFGTSIANFGMIKNMIADMTVRTYICQSLQHRIAGDMKDTFSGTKDPNVNSKAIEEYAIECSISKVYGAETSMICADKLVQIYGGMGFIEEYPAAEIYRDARILRIFEGTDEINRLLTAGTILKRVMTGRLNLMGAVGEAYKSAAAYNPASVQLKNEPLAGEEHTLKMAKTIALATVKNIMAKLIMNPEDQELLAMIAEIVMEIYAMESGLLRAKKALTKNGEKKAEYYIAAASIYCSEIMPRIAFWAKQAVAYAMDNDPLLQERLNEIDNMAYNVKPVNYIKLRRKIAERVIKAKKYIF